MERNGQQTPSAIVEKVFSTEIIFRLGMDFFFLFESDSLMFFQFGLNLYFFSAHDKGRDPWYARTRAKQKIGKILFITLRSG